MSYGNEYVACDEMNLLEKKLIYLQHGKYFVFENL